MYDALAPAVNALDSAVSEGLDKTDALKLALVAAESGRDATTPMLARKAGPATSASEASGTKTQAPPRSRCSWPRRRKHRCNPVYDWRNGSDEGSRRAADGNT